tara:strand:- start:133 stop:864 length:732 start_codon:yes stop_codon:yes gene_type:complete
MNREIISFLFVLLLSSCVIQKTERASLSIHPKNAKELIERVNEKNKTPEWMALKGKVSLMIEDKSLGPLNISIKIRKDSVIWASVSAPLGIELFRTMLTKDSLFYINQMNKTFFVKPTSDIAELFNFEVSFFEIQDIISGNVNIKKQKYKLEEGFFLLAENINYVINPTTFQVKSMKLIQDLSFLEVQYSYSAHIGKGHFSNEVNIESNFKENNNIKLVYAKIILNEKQKTPFKIPASYVERE